MPKTTENTYVFTSESVAAGHPDKVCDLISDALVDLYLAKDPKSKLAIETLVTKDLVVLAGEIKSDAEITSADHQKVVRQTLKEIGYDQPGFDYQTVEIKDALHTQSPDIAQGIELLNGDIGAGDQGMMIGYATNETPDYLPAPLYYSHRILETLAQMRLDSDVTSEVKNLGPDAKVQLSLTYQDQKPVGVDTLVLSIQHPETLSQSQVSDLVLPVVKGILPTGWISPETKIHVNPTGRFVIGGPVADTGLTGRKIIVDTYGSAAAHGGGAFSGKDPTKVDRSGAYMARYLAKNIVAAGLADKCTLQIAYGIGLAEPVSLYVNFHGTGQIKEARIEALLRKTVDLTPKGIIKTLDLRRPIYKQTAAYGHFGRRFNSKTGEFPWENLNLVKDFRVLLPTDILTSTILL